MALGLSLGVGLSRPQQAAAAAGGGTIAALLDVATLVIDWPRGVTAGPYAETTGTDPVADGGDFKSLIPEVGAVRWGDAASEFPSWHNNVTDNIDGAGVMRLASATDQVAAVSNTDPTMSQTKWWVYLKGRTLAGTTTSFRVLANLDGQSARVVLSFAPGSNTMRLAVHNGTSATNYDFTVNPSSVFFVAAYYDGTDLHLWLNTATVSVQASTGALGTLNATLPTRLFLSSTTGLTGWECSACWVGNADGNDIDQHLLDMQALIDDRA